MRPLIALLALGVCVSADTREADLLVIGAGPAGLSAALEAGRRGARVIVVDVNSMFGGHAVLSEGGLSFWGTPLQAAKGIKDSAELATQDFLHWGGDANPAWVELYVERARPEVHDWLAGMGLEFTSLRLPTGNSVARFHENAERGFGVVKPIYRECLRTPGIEFLWNTRITKLRIEGSKATGASGVRLRNGEAVELRAPAVLIATGGFQNNIALVKKHWPGGKAPEKILLGSGAQSKGSGLELATAVGAALERLDHQWNYTWGFADPRDASGERGIFIRIMTAIWVNRAAERFVDEIASPKFQMAAISKQPGGRYWAIFDEAAKASAATAGAEWGDRTRVERIIFRSLPSASTLAELAAKIGVPAAKLAATVERYNTAIASGKDADHKRFGFERDAMQMAFRRAPERIERGPFYAMPLQVITRKSLGGVRIDLSCRVLNAAGRPIPGLYAAGEVTGFGGLNGSAGLEGTFIAPAILQGRIVGRLVSEGKTPVSAKPATDRDETVAGATGTADDKACLHCHNIPVLIAKAREGYWHFEQSHKVVQARAYSCSKCHKEMAPFRAGNHKMDRVAQIDVCATCHLDPPPPE